MRKGTHHTAETKLKFKTRKLAFLGKHHTKEAIEKIRAANIGENNPNYGRPSPQIGRHRTEESKQKMRKPHKPHARKPHTEETKQKLREANLGKKHSEVAKQKCRKAAIEKMQSNPQSTMSKSATMFLNRIEESFNVGIEREFEINGKFFDGKCNNVLIEVDCEYWHKTRKMTDLFKDYLAESRVYKLYRFNVDSQREVDKKFQEYSPILKQIFTN